DLILEKDGVLVFCEVKTRGDGAAVAGREAVDVHKQQRLIRAAQGYMAGQKGEEPPARFDVVEVVLKRDGKSADIRRIEHAFTL
ncbi:MAG: YraN family protein, partial [Oscillospiraceae bacterium]